MAHNPGERNRNLWKASIFIGNMKIWQSVFTALSRNKKNKVQEDSNYRITPWKRKRRLFPFPSWWLYVSGSPRCVQCWSPFLMFKISSMKSQTCPLTWPAIHLSLEKTSKLKKLLFGNINYMEATIILSAMWAINFGGLVS